MLFILILENSSGDRIDMTTTANQYMTSKISGLHPPPGTVSTSSYAGMDGSYLNNAFIEKRNLVISFEMRGVGMEKRRHALYRVVKPSRYIKVFYKTAGIDVYTEGYVETCEIDNFQTHTNGQISILCPDPYWYNTFAIHACYSRVSGGFFFPFPQSDEPFILGSYSTTDNIEIRNDGDETGFIIQIEAVTLETDAEDGDYLTVTGRFLMSLLSRRIIYPTLLFSALTSYADMVRLAVYRNCMQSDNRLIPGLRHGNTSGTCWEQKSRLQVSYENLMEWIFKVCEMIGGTANIRLQETSAGSGVYTMMLDLAQGTDRSILQEDNAHIVFSDSYCNLLTFGYSMDLSAQKNVAYVLGCGEGTERKRTVCYRGSEPAQLNRYEVYMDAKDVSDETQENGETVAISDEDYLGLLMEKGAENLVPITEISESTIAADARQYQYNKDYFVGDYVTVEHERFGLIQPRIQLVGMIESYDQNGRTLTPTFRKG